LITNRQQKYSIKRFRMLARIITVSIDPWKASLKLLRVRTDKDPIGSPATWQILISKMELRESSNRWPRKAGY
jgi:hypothetical protein